MLSVISFVFNYGQRRDELQGERGAPGASAAGVTRNPCKLDRLVRILPV